MNLLRDFLAQKLAQDVVLVVLGLADRGVVLELVGIEVVLVVALIVRLGVESVLDRSETLVELLKCLTHVRGLRLGEAL